MKSRLIECVINYEYETGKFADASCDWDRNHPASFDIRWEESDGYCSMHPACELTENSSDDDVLNAMELWGDTSDVTIWEGCEE